MSLNKYEYVFLVSILDETSQLSVSQSNSELLINTMKNHVLIYEYDKLNSRSKRP